MGVTRYLGADTQPTVENLEPLKRQVVQDAVRTIGEAFPAQVILTPSEGDRQRVREATKLAVQGGEQRLGLWGRIRPEEEDALIQEVMDRVLGLGFLEALLPPRREDVSEIALNPDGSIWIMPRGKSDFEPTDIHVEAAEAKRIIDKILGPQNRMITEAEPLVFTKLPRSPRMPGGARVTVIAPPISNGDVGYVMNIRLYEPKPVKPEQLLAWKMLSPEMVDFLRKAIKRRRRIMIAGSTATGKTTFLSALAEMIDPPTERVVLIEDPAEIFLDLPHVISLEARPPNIEGKYGVTLGQLVTSAMRLSPRWLILGEVRTGDAGVWLLRAQMSDHAGLSTIHSDSPASAIETLGLLAQLEPSVQAKYEAIKKLVSRAVNYFVQIYFDPWGVRRVERITKVMGMSRGNVELRDVYRYVPEKSTKDQPVWEWVFPEQVSPDELA